MCVKVFFSCIAFSLFIGVTSYVDMLFYMKLVVPMTLVKFKVLALEIYILP